MRELADEARIRQFMRALGSEAAAPGRVFSPSEFIPVREDWADRSPFIAQDGRLAYHHFDFTAQALAKIERGHGQDLDDVRAMFGRALIDATGIRDYFAAIQPRLYRYPAIDPVAFARAVDAALGPAG